MPRVKQIEKRSRKSKNIVNKCKICDKKQKERGKVKGYERVYNRARN